MTAANAIGALFGTVLVVYGLVGKGNFYNEVEAPLSDEEQVTPPKPFTNLDDFLILEIKEYAVVAAAEPKPG